MNVGLIIFDDFTDIDLFLIWDMLGRKKFGWTLHILGQKKEHLSMNGMWVKTHKHISNCLFYDVIIFCSGRGAKKVIKDAHFINNIILDQNKQLICSICAGALILATLGLLDNATATTHPAVRKELEEIGQTRNITLVDKPIVTNGNITTAGGCLSGVYLAAWVVENKYGIAMREKVVAEVAPTGQLDHYQQLVDNALRNAVCNPEMRPCC